MLELGGNGCFDGVEIALVAFDKGELRERRCNCDSLVCGLRAGFASTGEVYVSWIVLCEMYDGFLTDSTRS